LPTPARPERAPRRDAIVPSVPLRRRFLLAAVAIVPLALVSGIGLYLLSVQQRAQVERVSLELARVVTTAVDAELRSSVSVLEALAAVLTLERNERAAFHERARRVLETQPTWAAISLTDPVGTRVADTRYLPGGELPTLAERESFEQVVRTRAPAVGGLARAAGGPLLFAVRVPILRDGTLHYVLSASVRPEDIRDVITRQQVPSDWVISIFDQHGRRVARSRAHEEGLGGPASPSLQALLVQGAKEGIGPTYTLEGERLYTPYSRLSPSGWTAALGLPAAVVEGAMYRSLAVYGGGLLLSLALGTLAALLVARSINRPIADLRDAAQALGRGEAMPPPATAIQEIRDVAEALVTAAAERRHAEVQERRARETAEEADRAKEQFLAVLSHELRTPLNAVYGWARMLQAGQLRGDDAVRAVEAIVRNADMQVQLIDDLLDVLRIVSGKMRLDVRAVDLAAVVDSALDAVRPAAQAKGDPRAERAGPARGPGDGGSRPAPAGAVESPHERGQVHPQERASAGPSPAGEFPRRDHGERYRPGHRTRHAPLCVRPLPPVGQLDHADSRRAGPRARAGEAPRGAARRQRARPERRRRLGRDLRGEPAALDRGDPSITCRARTRARRRRSRYPRSPGWMASASSW
jgi:hypothetical protein